MRPDAIVIRHSSSGAPHLLARTVSCAIINAGDGFHEHPTQALLDLFTIRETKGRIAGLEVAIVGDVLHSRVARSNLYGLAALGARVRLIGPPTLLPEEFREYGAELFHDLREGVDRLCLLRPGRELGEQRRPLAAEGDQVDERIAAPRALDDLRRRPGHPHRHSVEPGVVCQLVARLL